MEYRNATYNAHGTIDVEIEHPVFGWIPFTASPDDSEEFGRELFAEVNLGEAGPYLVPPPIVEDYTAAIVSMLDAKAKERRYDNAMSLATYEKSTDPQWSAEATAFIAWRDAVWAYAYAELKKVELEQRSQPTVEGFLAELPVMSWPT